MSQKESFDGAVKDNYFDVLVRFDRRDDLVELRNGVRTENIERRMVNGYSPIVGRAPRKMYLLPHLSFGLHTLSPMNFQSLFKCAHWQGERAFVATRLPRHLENEFQLDRGAEWKTGDAVNQAAGVLLFSEVVLKQL